MKYIVEIIMKILALIKVTLVFRKLTYKEREMRVGCFFFTGCKMLFQDNDDRIILDST